MSFLIKINRIGGVMVSVLASSGFQSRSVKPIQDYNIGICCFPAKHAACRRKNKSWMARNQDNVSQ